MEKTILKIEGMHCSGCSIRLERVLNGIEGVSAKVSLENKNASVEYDTKKVTLNQICEAIEDAGFDQVLLFEYHIQH